VITEEIEKLKPRLHQFHKRLRNRGFPAKDANEAAQEWVAINAEANVLEKFGTRIVTSWAWDETELTNDKPRSNERGLFYLVRQRKLGISPTWTAGAPGLRSLSLV